MSTLLRELKQGITHLFYPRLCEGCSKPLVDREEVLCMNCETELPETGYHNIMDNQTAQQLAGRIPFIHATSFAYFTDEGLLQHLLHGLKYKNKKYIGLYLGELSGRRLMETGWANNIDMIIPVPLHPAKEAKRGYNQSLLIAEGMSKAIGKPAQQGALIRNRQTESQTRKTRNERVSNMKGAFGIAQKGSLNGRHILLCDDVLTTGATIEACAQALLEEESIKISVATIGIAVS